MAGRRRLAFNSKAYIIKSLTAAPPSVFFADIRAVDFSKCLPLTHYNWQVNDERYNPSCGQAKEEYAESE
jgi:hypothetical protein